MDNQLLYQQLGNSDDYFAQDLANNVASLPSLRIIAFYILNEDDKAKAIYDSQSETGEISTEEDIFLLEAKVVIGQIMGTETNILRKIAESLVSHIEWATYSRLYLATLQESEGDFPKAIELFQHVLKLCPHNTVALAGLVRLYIKTKQNENAKRLLKTIQKDKPFSKLRKSKNRYWTLTLLNYAFIVWRIEIVILVAIGMFSLAFMLPNLWIIPTLAAGICLAFAYLCKINYGVDVSTMKRLAIAIVLIWLSGYASRMLFNYLENL